MYGTQASRGVLNENEMFENDVKMYGTQAQAIYNQSLKEFENDVMV